MSKKNKQPQVAATETPATPVKGKSVISHQRKQLWAAKPDDQLDAALAEAMLGSEAALIEVAHENSVEFRWSHLNRGMQRMALGNVLRGKLRRSEPVAVAGQPISA